MLSQNFRAKACKNNLVMICLISMFPNVYQMFFFLKLLAKIISQIISMFSNKFKMCAVQLHK